MTGRRMVLLVDFDPRSIEALSKLLAGAGYTVEVRGDGLSAREAFEQLLPDVVVAEALLPKRNGFDLCRDIKRHPMGSQTPVVIATGVYRGRTYRNQALHVYGCDEFLEKPVPGAMLLDTLERLLGRVSFPTEAGSPLSPRAPVP